MFSRSLWLIGAGDGSAFRGQALIVGGHQEERCTGAQGRYPTVLGALPSPEG